MSKQQLLAVFDQSPQNKQLIDRLSSPKSDIKVSNLVGSSFSFVIASLFKNTEKPFLLILEDKEEAAGSDS